MSQSSNPEHSRNIAAEARVSLLFDGTQGFANPQQGPRVTIMGRIAKTDEPRHRQRFLARHPAAALYADFSDFSFYVVEPTAFHIIGGFARATWLRDRLTLPREIAESFAAAEPDILDHMNEDHRAALDRMAERAGQSGAGWRMAGIDPDGCDLVWGEQVIRLDFDRPLGDPAEARPALTALSRLTPSSGDSTEG